MSVLDTEELIKKIDKNGMLQSINDFPDQIEQAWNKAQNFVVPTPYIKVNRILILGMGGTAVSAGLIKNLADFENKTPTEVLSNYNVPAYVDHRTLVIALSYSGETEETISAFDQAASKGAKLIAISSGGQLASICRKYRAPIFNIDYGAEARAAIGYTLIPLVAIYHKLGFINLGENELKQSLDSLRNFQRKIRTEIPSQQNLAKQLAEHLLGKIAFVIGNDLMTEIAHRFKTQINENAKTLAINEVIPELCHNSINGLDWPEKLKDKILVVMLQSRYDFIRNRLRQQILTQILHKKGISYESVFIDSNVGRLAEILQGIHFSDYVSYYLALLNKVDPTKLEMAEYLKDKLSETK